VLSVFLYCFDIYINYLKDIELRNFYVK